MDPAPAPLQSPLKFRRDRQIPPAITQQIGVERREQSKIRNAWQMLARLAQSSFRKKGRLPVDGDVFERGHCAGKSSTCLRHRQTRPGGKVFKGGRTVGKEVPVGELRQRWLGPGGPSRHPVIERHISWFAVGPLRTETANSV